jgi:hypothetical protein
MPLSVESEADSLHQAVMSGKKLEVTTSVSSDY